MSLRGDSKSPYTSLYNLSLQNSRLPRHRIQGHAGTAGRKGGWLQLLFHVETEYTTNKDRTMFCALLKIVKRADEQKRAERCFPRGCLYDALHAQPPSSNPWFRFSSEHQQLTGRWALINCGAVKSVNDQNQFMTESCYSHRIWRLYAARLPYDPLQERIQAVYESDSWLEQNTF